jgi:hypothetical protein
MSPTAITTGVPPVGVEETVDFLDAITICPGQHCARRATSPENAELKGGDVPFVMQDEWKEEPASTTGAEYVEPSATELIKPGQRISHLFPRSVMEEFILQRVTERVWWVTRQFYASLFYV